jgi:hypothetical protein
MGWKNGTRSVSRRLTVAAVVGLVVALLPTCPALGAGVEPADAATGGDDSVFVDRCVSDADREAAAAGGKHEAFRQSTIPLGPFFWATADRELIQAMLLYWRILDVEDDTRLTLVLPLFVDHCAPDARTWMGPFGMWGGQTDAAGTAGWWGPYFYRRDDGRESDVLFPLLWSFRDQQQSTTVVGPYFNAHRPEHDVFGFMPLYLGYRDRAEGFLDLAPGYVRWGRGRQSDTILLQTWHRTRAQTSTTLSVPFWLSHEDRTDDSWLRLAPGFASWGDPQTSTLLAGPWYARSTAHGAERGVLPIFVSGEATSTEHRGALDLLRIEPDQPYSYTLIPPLLFGRVVDNDGSTTWLAQTRVESRAGRSSIWSAPLIFHARDEDPTSTNYTVIPPLAFVWLEDKPKKTETLIAGPWVDVETERTSTQGLLPLWLGNRSKVDGGYWDVVPPLAFARWGDGDERQTLVGQTLYMRGPKGWSLWSFPFAFVGHDDELKGVDYAIVPPLAFAHVGIEERSYTLAGTGWLFDTPDQLSAGVLPLFGFGRGYDDTGDTVDGWELIPPLLTWHRWDARSSSLVAGPFYRFQSDDGLHRGLAPLFFQGRGTGGRRYDVAPLALTALYSDEETTFAWIAQTIYWRNAASGDFHLTSLPLFTVGRSGRRRHAVVPAATFAHWGDEREDHTLLLNTYMWRYDKTAPAERQGRLVLSPPFYFGQRSPNGRYMDVVPTLAFARWGDRAQRVMLAGPYLDVERLDTALGDERYQVLPPAFFRYSTDQRRFTLVPGAAWWSSEVGPRPSTSVLVGQTYASWTQRAWSAASVPFYFGFSNRDDDTYAHVIPPLGTAIWKTDDTDAKVIAGYFDVEDQHGRDTGLLPFYLQGASREGHTTTPLTEVARSVLPAGFDAALPRSQHRWAYRLAPGYVHLEHDEMSTDVIGQTYWQKTGKGSLFGSAPFYHGARGEEGAYLDVAPPLLFARHSDGVSRRLWWGPWLSYDNDHADEHSFMLLPVAMGQRDATRAWLLTPAGGAWRDEQGLKLWIVQTLVASDDDGWSALSVPVYAGVHNDKRQEAFDLLPPLALGRASKGTHDALLIGPYASLTTSVGDESLRGLAPLFVAYDSPDKASVITPVGAWWRRGDRARFFFAQTWGRSDPGGWSVASMPFYVGFRDDDRQMAYDVVPPLAFGRVSSGSRQALLLGPYASVTDAAGEESLRGLAPFFVSHHSADKASVLTPVGAWWRDRQRTGFWFAQTWGERGDDRWSFTSAPLYFGSEEATGGYHVIPPLAFVRAWNDDGDHISITGPAYDIKDGDQVWRGLLPIYASAVSDRGGFTMAPGFWHRWDARRGTGDTWVLNTHVTTDRDAWRVASHPFYYGGAGAGLEGDYHHAVPLALVFAWGRERLGEHRLIVGPLVSFEQPSGRDRGLLPLWMSGEGKGEGSVMSPVVSTLASTVFGREVKDTFQHESGFSYAMAPGLFTVADGAGSRALLVGQTFVFHSDTAWKAWSAPVYFGADDGNAGYHLVPPALSGHAHDAEAGTHTTVIGPLAYASWGDRRAQTTLAGPWFDHASTGLAGEQRRVRGIAPLWLDAREDDRFLQAYSPLFWRWGDKGEQRAIGPGIWYSKAASASDLIVFPFFWDIARPSFDVTMAAGVYWSFAWRGEASGHERSLLLTPGYARYDDHEETLHVAGPVAFSRGKGDHAAAWSTHLGPLLSLYSYHANHFRWKALMGVLGYEREGDVEQYTFFFVKTKPTHRRAGSNAAPAES